MTRDDGAREYFEKLILAEKYCGGDTENAKRMLAGDYNDIIVFKGRFKGESQNYGLFQIFINILNTKLVFSHGLVSSFMSVYTHKPFDEWFSFYDDILKEGKDAEIDQDKTTLLNDSFKWLINNQVLQELTAWVEVNDITNITDKFHNMIENILKTDDLKVILDFEPTSSLVLHDKTGLLLGETSEEQQEEEVE